MNNGQNIPQGYKKTTIGFIPQGWEIKRLKTIVTPIKTFSYSRDKLSDNVQTLIYIHYGDIHKSGEKYSVNLNVDRLPYLMDGILSENQISANDFPKLQSGDILLPDASEDYDGIGHAWELQNVGQQNVIGGLHTIAIRPNPQFVLLGYGSLMFYSWPVSKALKRIAQGTKVYSISFNLIDNIKILLPPLKEQQKIAEVLGTWDKAIEKQSQLIIKLELRKKGLMQQLLTGKKRLPGFSGEWRKVKLGDICERVTRKNTEDNKNVMTISAQRGFVVQTDFFNKSVASETLESYYLVLKDEFCYNKSYSNGYPMGAIKRLSEADKAVVTSLYICFNVKSRIRVSIDYLSFYFDNGGLNRGLTKIANEGGRAHGLLNVTPTDFFRLAFNIPSFEEQTTIAKVLTAADREIELAQQKLELLRQQKRGLMQQLLTGKKRVKL